MNKTVLVFVLLILGGCANEIPKEMAEVQVILENGPRERQPGPEPTPSVCQMDYLRVFAEAPDFGYLSADVPGKTWTGPPSGSHIPTVGASVTVSGSGPITLLVPKGNSRRIGIFGVIGAPGCPFNSEGTAAHLISGISGPVNITDPVSVNISATASVPTVATQINGLATVPGFSKATLNFPSALNCSGAGYYYVKFHVGPGLAFFSSLGNSCGGACTSVEVGPVPVGVPLKYEVYCQLGGGNVFIKDLVVAPSTAPITVQF